ncbi:hypothetical protein, partial [Enterococcus casseliflavus]|uniref:hypothetical protein n=1 Tax=Enterococcus casseliflavus TaxID=37734 RepID=UPI003D0D2FA8
GKLEKMHLDHADLACITMLPPETIHPPPGESTRPQVILILLYYAGAPPIISESRKTASRPSLLSIFLDIHE